MSRRPARFTEADIRRAVKALIGLGTNTFLQVSPDGTFTIGFKEPAVTAGGGVQKKSRVVV